MIFSASTKFRVIGSASVLALTAGLATTVATPAFAQSAPDPLAAPPVPTVPTPPANVEECALVAGTVTCAPGTDADGFFDASGDPLTLDVQDGSVVQSSIIITGTVTGAVDGAIVTGGAFESGLLVGANSDVTVNGFIGTSGNNAAGIETEDNASITNNGTISTTGNDADGVALAEGATFINNELVVTSGASSEGVFAFGDGVTINNTIAATIVTSNDGSAAIAVADGANVTNAGLVQTFGQFSAGVQTGANGTVVNSGNIATSGDNFSDAVVVGEGSSVTNSGAITTSGSESFGVFGAGDNVVVTNSGSIATQADGSFGIVTAVSGTVTNSGTIETNGEFAIGIDMLESGTVNNTGSVATVGTSAIGINGGTDSTVESDGSITTEGDNAYGISVRDASEVTLGSDSAISTIGGGAHGVFVQGNGTFSNAGTVSATGVGAFGALLTGDADVTNSGSIASTQGRGLDVLGVATVTNAEGGSITSQNNDAVRLFGDGSSLTNNGTLSGFVGVAGSDQGQTVANFGALTGTSGTAAQLGDGVDQFQQWTGATTTGDVDLGGGDDTFILEGTASSVDGSVLGGMGADAAIIAGTLDADNILGFETFQIGSTLGDTLNDAVISGARTVDGDVTVVGQVTLGLGVDSLTSTGAMTLEDGSTVTIETPLGAELLGQTVTVLQEGTTFTDNGATIEVIDNDLLIDYEVVIGSVAVQVNAANPILTSSDANILAFSTAFDAALAGSTLSDATFNALNDLPDLAALESAVAETIPALSEGAGREIFESSNTASAALDRHLAADGSGIWGEATIRGADQDASSLTSGGYESEQLIFTAGGDFAATDAAKVGALVSYAEIENDDLSGGVETGTTDVESIKLAVYGGVEFAERGFVNVELSYLTGEVDQARTSVLGPIASTFDFDGFGYRAVVGYDILDNSAFSVTPTIGINGANLSFDTVSETGGFGFTVDRDDADFLELRGGLELAGDLGSGLTGYVAGAYAYDLEDDQRVFALSSTELGNLNVLVAEREQSRFELSVGAAFNVTDNATIEVGYSGDYASGYDAHAGRASVRIGF
ncbi:MAG: autotransporter domain-containing protein [Pseudomonadota bacterium]